MALLERDTLTEKLPKGTDAEVQQLFVFLVNQSFQILSANTVLYQRLLTAPVEDGDAAIAWFVEESGKPSD